MKKNRLPHFRVPHGRPHMVWGARALSFIGIALACLSVVLTSANAWGAQSPGALLNTPFQKAEGGTLVLSSLDAQRGILVAFWASWCVPCKEELAFLVAHTEDLKGVTVVSLNVDESSDWPAAQSQLASLGWKGLSLRDPGGVVFYTLNSASELPYAVYFQPGFNNFQVFHAVTSEVLNELKGEQKSTSGLAVSESAQFLQGRGQNSEKGAFANSVAVKYSDAVWNLQLSHDLLKQKTQSHCSKFEDDLGNSFAQFTFPTPYLENSRASLRAGDDSVDWLGGQLLSVRPSPILPELQVVQGAHAHLSADHFAVDALGGQIRRLLAPRFLLLDRDLSQATGKNRIAGLNLRTDWGSPEKGSLTLGAGGVRRLKLEDPKRGQLNTSGDFRAGFVAAVQKDRAQLEARTTGYSTDSGTQNKSARATQLDGSVPLGPEAPFVFLGSLSTANHLPDFTLVPALVDTLGVPLDAADKRAARGQLRYDAGESFFNSSATAYYTHEVSLNLAKQDSKEHLGVVFVAPQLNAKAQFYAAWANLKSVQNKTLERAFLAASPLYGALSGQYLYRDISKSEEGHQHKLNLNLDLTELFEKTQAGKITLEGAQAWQSGELLRTSGLSKRTTTSAFFVWRANVFSLRAGGGQEPGGVVCADGICAQKPAFDGMLAEANVEWNF